MIRVVKIVSSSFDSAKRLLSKFERMGKDDIQETLTISPPGTDASPIKDMVAIHAKTGVSGESVVIGFINKDCIAKPGEHRIFSTNSDGVLQTYLHLKDDGTVEFGGNSKNMVRFQELETGFNELKANFNTLVTTFNTHVHSGVTTGPGSSLITPTPGTSSTASIAGAKIDEIKTL